MESDETKVLKSYRCSGCGGQFTCEPGWESVSGPRVKDPDAELAAGRAFILCDACFKRAGAAGVFGRQN